jgi:hypothetical protein
MDLGNILCIVRIRRIFGSSEDKDHGGNSNCYQYDFRKEKEQESQKMKP